MRADELVTREDFKIIATRQSAYASRMRMRADELENQIATLEKRINANELVTRELAHRIDAVLVAISKLTELQDMRKYFAPRWTAAKEHELVDEEYRQIINSHSKIHYQKAKKKVQA